MRLFEILIAIILGLALAGWLYPRWRHPRIVHILPFAAVLIVPLHLLIDGHRWQTVFPALLPVKDLPEPGGPYGVGRWSIELTDSSMAELFTADPDDRTSLERSERRGFCFVGVTARSFVYTLSVFDFVGPVVAVWLAPVVSGTRRLAGYSYSGQRWSSLSHLFPS